MAGSLWVREIKRNKIRRDIVVPCSLLDWQQALQEACQQMDLAFPLVVARHEKDFADFSQTRFLPDHFLEGVTFDRLEVEYYDPEDKNSNKQSGRQG